MPTYITEVDVHGSEFQNAQELVRIWGAIREEVEELGGEVVDTHAVLGDYDFLIVYAVDDEEQAFQVTQAIERHGLDTKTMQGLPIDRIGELVDDV
ncbi:GYD domain-containing protein [Halosimplex pelagicum]|uniref:GYD domain-containing protein n=1 Tax=Halosimplex pelagicum TaxID=869886 RepID=A0A7D5TQX9_9EURY|nr:GYD domain-containing protein [Halosimplex pelagicum]QLH80772.1 GYD domain-containing protein [Halosimplex pelagicum]